MLIHLQLFSSSLLSPCYLGWKDTKLRWIKKFKTQMKRQQWHFWRMKLLLNVKNRNCDVLTTLTRFLFAHLIPVVVVIAFFLCWCPFHVQRIIFTYIEHRAIDENLSFSINYISGVLFFVSTCINPFLYNMWDFNWKSHAVSFFWLTLLINLFFRMSNKFREAFKVIMKYWMSFCMLV